jgi:hypothetical protein
VLLERERKKESSAAGFSLRKLFIDIEAGNMGGLKIVAGPAWAVFSSAEEFPKEGLTMSV